ncbi:MAG: ribosomal protein [Acidobacteriaceae bacterium]|jgi:large subunit ribosomal protein L21|nr:ribosomal protein [Acidobacteriaceae bacterium]
MYAVIRAGGKQYRVAPGDVLRLETQAAASNGTVEFNDVLAVSASEGQIARPESNAVVTGEILNEGRAKKILVFHYKKKKQYKKLNGHRQPFSSVRITEIAFDGQKFSAPALPKKEAKPKKVASAKVESRTEEKAEAKAAKPAAKKKAAAPKKSVAKKSPGKKK